MLEYKFFGNWRQVICVNDVEYCEAMKNPESALAKIVHGDSLQGLLKPCPYLPAHLSLNNFTNAMFIKLDKFDGEGKLKPDPGGNQWYFKGDMRITVKLRTDEDPKMLNLVLVYTLNFRNADSF